MIEGPAGLQATGSPGWRPHYEPSKRRLTWPNGARATVFSADEPERLRGPQHDFFWADEPAAWRYPEAWDQLMFGLRLGERPRGIATTTPKPIKIIRDLLGRPDVAISRGTTYENRANLAPAFFQEVIKRYEGTRLGRQELQGEVLEDVPGALWTWASIDEQRVSKAPPELDRIVVAIDPAVTSSDGSDETGIVVAARKGDHAYVLDDLSLRSTPIEWCRKAVGAYRDRLADRIIAEVNNGGDLVESQLRVVDDSVSYEAVHASRGKRKRAEPVAALYEQKRVHHVGSFPELEDQMVTFVPDEQRSGESPDRADALVYALTALLLEERRVFVA